jgi:hypothetical protein
MITKEDVIGLCGLTEEEVAAIAEHEHVPDIVAAALADYLLHKDKGASQIREIIVDDIRGALDRRNFEHASRLFKALDHFLSTYPEARPV